MLEILLSIAAWTMQLPNVETFEAYDWRPKFSELDQLQISQPTIALFTHASRHFDPLCLTQSAVNRVASTMKHAELPTFYLHDSYNENNPAWLYLYEDWRPTAFLRSDVGNVDLKLSHVRHVVSLGGYFGQCQRSTVQDVIRCWRRDAPDSDFRVTQIVDGIFCVGEYLKWEDPFRDRVREYFYEDLRKRHPNSAIMVQDTLSFIQDQDLAIDFLVRQIPLLPSDINVVIDFFGHTETVLAPKNSHVTLTLAYRHSNRFLHYRKCLPDADNVVSRKLSGRTTSTIKLTRP